MEERKGSQTSEYKLAAGGLIGGFAVAVATALSGHPKIALAMAAMGSLLAASYGFMRTWLKKERAGAVDWLNTQQEATLEKALRAVGTLSEVLKLVVADDEPAGPAEEPSEGQADDAG